MKLSSEVSHWVNCQFDESVKVMVLNNLLWWTKPTLRAYIVANLKRRVKLLTGVSFLGVKLSFI